MIYLVAVFNVSVVAVNLFLMWALPSARKSQNCLLPVATEEKRALQILSVVMKCKLSMFELREAFLIMNYHEKFVLVYQVAWMCFL